MSPADPPGSYQPSAISWKALSINLILVKIQYGPANQSYLRRASAD